MRPAPRRPRSWGRPSLVVLAGATTAVSLLGSLGVIPAGGPAAAARPAPAEVASLSSGQVLPDARPPGRRQQEQAPAVPGASGAGTRVVFDMGEQRVWLVQAGAAGAEDVVRRTYLASGSVYDNLRPGTYEVYSRSRHAVGIGDSGTMEYFVRFTRGANAAIGFHSIPVHDGEPVQSRAQLGTPLSHGCIRQARPDARALWDFAPVGTPVVVTA